MTIHLHQHHKSNDSNGNNSPLQQTPIITTRKNMNRPPVKHMILLQHQANTEPTANPPCPPSTIRATPITPTTNTPSQPTPPPSTTPASFSTLAPHPPYTSPTTSTPPIIPPTQPTHPKQQAPAASSPSPTPSPSPSSSPASPTASAPQRFPRRHPADDFDRRPQLHPLRRHLPRQRGGGVLQTEQCARRGW